ncbi:MAG: arsenic efflux protein, partial [Eubacteriales bacterium]
GEVFLDTLLEFLPVIAILFLSYLLMEWMEHRMSERSARFISRTGVFAPAVGGLLGCVPQCGFSAAAAGLYAGRVITLGTLYAVFLSTSDEMLPIMLSDAWKGEFAWWSIFRVLGGKMVIGILLGMAFDLVFRLMHKKHADEDAAHTHEEHAEETAHEQDHDDHDHDHAHHHEHDHHDEHEHSHGCDHAHNRVGQIHELCERTGCRCEEGIFKSALRHTLKIGVLLLVFSLALNLLFHFVGEDTLAAFLSGKGWLTHFLAALVGLIPNCAASVAVTELYLGGVISVGALYAGLLPSAGVGLLVLCRMNRPKKESALIILGLYLMGVVLGCLIDLFGMDFLGLAFY